MFDVTSSLDGNLGTGVLAVPTSKDLSWTPGGPTAVSEGRTNRETPVGLQVEPPGLRTGGPGRGTSAVECRYPDRKRLSRGCTGRTRRLRRGRPDVGTVHEVDHPDPQEFPRDKGPRSVGLVFLIRGWRERGFTLVSRVPRRTPSEKLSTGLCISSVKSPFPLRSPTCPPTRGTDCRSVRVTFVSDTVLGRVCPS